MFSSTEQPLHCVSSLGYMNYNTQASSCRRPGADNVSRCYSVEIYLYTLTILKAKLYGISGSFTLNYVHFRHVLNKFKLTYVSIPSHHLKMYPANKNLNAAGMIDQLFTGRTNQDV